MTDARERLAKEIYGARNGRGALAFSQRDGAHKAPYLKDADAILPALNLTPEAASALMDGTAVVVPVEPTDEMSDAAWESEGTDYVGEHHRIHNFGDAYQSALDASPYRINSNG